MGSSTGPSAFWIEEETFDLNVTTISGANNGAAFDLSSDSLLYTMTRGQRTEMPSRLRMERSASIQQRVLLQGTSQKDIGDMTLELLPWWPLVATAGWIL